MNKKTQKKTITIMTLVVILIILSVATFLVVKKYSQKNTTSNTDQKQLPDGTSIQNKSSSNNSSASPAQPSQSSSISLSITQVSQTDTLLNIRALVNGASNGKCVLTLTKDSITVTKTGTIAQGPSYYYCNGFSIAKTELKKGQWQMNIKAESNGKEGNVNQTITVE